MDLSITLVFIICFKGCMSEILYDLCIIGAGMFGSSAAKHASANPGLRICLIGLEEPTSFEEKKTRQIFGAHYDEGRIVETIDPLVETQVLSRNSMKAYRELEKLSGISFYTPIGMLSIGKKFSSWMENIEQGATRNNRDSAVVISNNGCISKKVCFQFPYLRIKDNEYALMDDTGAGYINPRNMIEAQKRVALLQGCHIIPDVVNEVKDPNSGYHVIETGSHGRVKAKRVLFATGAFTNFKKFQSLPKLDITAFKETVALLRISNEEAQKLSSMPPVVYSSEESQFNAYILPPISYPDGNQYLKIGALTNGDREQQILHDLESIRRWYLGNGDQNVVERGSKFLLKFLPGLKVERITSASCVVAGTPSSLPFIDRITPTVTVALAGNGRGAKICEEVGRLAAHLSLTGKWDSELPKRLFNAIPK